MAPHDELAYLRLGVATEQNAMRQNDGGVSARLHRLQDVQQEGIVAALRRRNRRNPFAMPPAAEGIFLARALEPALHGEWGIGNDIVECAKFAVVALVQGIGQRVSVPEIGIVHAMNDHRHARHADGRYILFLALYGNGPLRLRRRAKEKRPGTASRIVNRDHLARIVADTNHLRHYAAHFCRRVELAFRLAGLRGEVLHQVFVGVADQVVVGRAVVREVEIFVLEHADEPAHGINEILSFAQLRFVRKVGVVDHAFKVIRLGDTSENDIHFLADVLATLEKNEVVEAATLRQFNQERLVARFLLVAQVLDEQHHQHIVLVLARVHSAAQLVARFPELGIKL